ncbi:MAG: hypothetical protein J6T50_01340, partial [Lachnospiraceae bacterium]|nr:hypothetical protein [Lachnospiraceae bacterium]
MKKKFLAVLLAGMMVGALAACGGTAEVTEEPPISVEEETEEEEPVEDEDVIEDEEEEIVSPDHVFDIPESVWIYGKSHDTWFVTEGLFWYAVDLDGETVDEGTLY